MTKGQGKARTPATDDLARIFYAIRTSRSGPIRRSWQRRARLALDNFYPDLTPAERHEVCCVWSRKDCDRIASKALRKVNGSSRNGIVNDWEHLNARQFMRAGFDSEGQPTRKKKKPGIARLAAANDSVFNTTSRSPCTPPHHVAPGTHAAVATNALSASPLRLASSSVLVRNIEGNARLRAGRSSSPTRPFAAAPPALRLHPTRTPRRPLTPIVPPPQRRAFGAPRMSKLSCFSILPSRVVSRDSPPGNDPPDELQRKVRRAMRN